MRKYEIVESRSPMTVAVAASLRKAFELPRDRRMEDLVAKLSS